MNSTESTRSPKLCGWCLADVNTATRYWKDPEAAHAIWFCSTKCADLFYESQGYGKPPKGDVRHDPVNRPSHYTAHKSGVEAITITEHMNFCLGNAMKYIWRADLKGGAEDLKKAKWYIERELLRRAKGGEK